MTAADRRLREVAKSPKLWQEFQEPKERLDDQRFSRPVFGITHPSPASKSQAPPSDAV